MVDARSEESVAKRKSVPRVLSLVPEVLGGESKLARLFLGRRVPIGVGVVNPDGVDLQVAQYGFTCSLVLVMAGTTQWLRASAGGTRKSSAVPFSGALPARVSALRVMPSMAVWGKPQKKMFVCC